MIERFARQVKQHAWSQLTSGWGRGHQLMWTAGQRPSHPAAADDQIMDMTNSGQPLPEPPGLKEIPKKYRAPESSRLTFEVKAGANTIDIDLTVE